MAKAEREPFGGRALEVLERSVQIVRRAAGPLGDSFCPSAQLEIVRQPGELLGGQLGGLHGNKR